MALSHSPSIITSNLVFCLDAANSKSYPGSGTTWTDLSGNGNNGTLVNGVGYDSDNGRSLSFDGVDDRVTLGTSYTNGYINITVSCWVYVVNAAGSQYIVTKYPGANGWLVYYNNTTNYFGVDGRESNAVYFNNVTTNTYPVNNWYNVVFTKSSTNWRLYVNSVLDINNTMGNGVTPFNNNGILAVGGIPAFSIYGKYQVSNTTIYNRALTPQEIQQNYNALRSRFQ